jgi:thioredoxin-related protein
VFSSDYTIESLNNEIKQSKKPMIIYFRKNVCFVCQKLEAKTLVDNDVKKVLKQFVFIEIDISNNTDENKKMLKEFTLFGTPSMIFIKNNKTLLDKTLSGYVTPEKFIKHLSTIVTVKLSIPKIQTVVRSEKNQDISEKLKSYKLMAHKGSKEAQFLVGVSSKDEVERIKWLKKSESQGCIGASGVLALHYLEKNNTKEGLKKLRFAAQNGDIGSQHVLAKILEEGKVTEQDLKESYVWYKVVEPYIPFVHMNLVLLDSKLSKVELSNLNKIVDEYTNNIKVSKELCQQSSPM